MILANTEENGEELIADSHLIPATMVGQIAGDKIRNYINSTASPTATIVFRGTVIGPSPPAPKVASFSSRGPNYRAHEILKPDVIAPGVNILAAWTGASSPTDLDIDPRRVEFNIISGTSMACPHVSGIAALLHTAHPEGDHQGSCHRGGIHAVRSWAGHVDPNSALDPGLLYDAQVDDYIAFLCSIGYTADQIALFTRDGSTANCSTTTLSSPGDLNYPAFSVLFSSHSDVVTYRRVVRNVGSSADAVYEVAVSAPRGVNVTVSPSRLEFNSVGQSLSYEVTFASAANPVIVGDNYAFGSILWADGSHNVRSPVAVTWPSSLVSSS
uniref:Uncharacterized protein n=1 Tax=Ananas comosus var. bracteatus TaxID=296719 RepID=A0A6V7P8T5_ANACO|nr:unnamed protein product [Ananas comosus var. bracteatus]